MPEIVVEVWGTRDLYQGPVDWLLPADRARYERFRHAGAAGQFLTGRALLRVALEARGLDYADVDLSAEKPRHPGVFFNLSHVEGLVAVALSEQELGLDVETTRRNTDIHNVGKRQYTASELAWMRAQVDPHRAFFKLWTLKEAYLKLTGEGFRRPTQSFWFEDDLARFFAPVDRPQPTWFWQQSEGDFEVAVAMDTPFAVAVKWAELSP